MLAFRVFLWKFANIDLDVVIEFQVIISLSMKYVVCNSDENVLDAYFLVTVIYIWTLVSANDRYE